MHQSEFHEEENVIVRYRKQDINLPTNHSNDPTLLKVQAFAANSRAPENHMGRSLVPCNLLLPYMNP